MTGVPNLSSAATEDLASTLDKLNLSQQEIGRFEKAFKDPDFLKLFEDYARDVHDPGTRAETDAYLEQLEQDNRIEQVYGQGTQLIIPSAEFVVKTQRASSSQKVFLNICSSDKVGEPKCRSAKQSDGASGHVWELPICSCAQAREGTDKKGDKCSVVDCTLHPRSITEAKANQRIHALLVDTCIEQAEGILKAKLSRSYTLPKLKFKATPEQPDRPCLTAVKGEKGTSSGGRICPVSTQHPQPTDKSTASLSGKPAKAPRSAFQFRNAPPAKNPYRPCEPGYKHTDGSVTPQYRVLHSEQIDLAEAWADSNVHAVPCMPRALIVRVDLPGLETVQDVELDIASKHLTLRVPRRFTLDLQLPFEVEGRRSTAKFDKRKNQLSVTAPLPAVPPPRPTMPKPVQEVNGAQLSDRYPPDLQSAESAMASRPALGEECSSASECKGDGAAIADAQVADYPQTSARDTSTDTDGDGRPLKSDTPPPDHTFTGVSRDGDYVDGNATPLEQLQHDEPDGHLVPPGGSPSSASPLPDHTPSEGAGGPTPLPGGSPLPALPPEAQTLPSRCVQSESNPRLHPAEQSTGERCYHADNTCAKTTGSPGHEIAGQDLPATDTTPLAQGAEATTVDPATSEGVSQSKDAEALIAAAKAWSTTHKERDGVEEHAGCIEEVDVAGKEQAVDVADKPTQGESSREQRSMHGGGCVGTTAIPHLEAVYDFAFVDEID